MIAPSLRRRLFASAALGLSFGAAGHAPHAAAQSVGDRAFQGVPNVVSGSAGISQSFALDTITIDTPQAIIDWTPQRPDGTPFPTGEIDFLPAGRTATFVGVQDYTVLNRILTTDPSQTIAFNGTVNSRVGAVGLPSQPGGSVWFYSPSGIIAGPTAVFNVGNLVLTADAIDATGGLFGPDGEIRFAAAPTSTARVDIKQSAQLNLLNSGSYLAIVAPSITQGGDVTVNGSVAYVATRQANVTINAGLFDISFAAGAIGATTLAHNGTTAGLAQTPARQIVMAAVSKNDAASMLLSGTIGYTPAATATVNNGTVILLGGYDSRGQLAGGPADIMIGNTRFTSSVQAQTTGSLLVAPTTTASFSGSASLSGDVGSIVRATNGATIDVGRDLVVFSRSTDGAVGGTASLIADRAGGAAAAITVAGNTSIDAGAGARLDGQAGQGGTATILIDGSRMMLTGQTTLSADARSRGSFTVSAGAATGGLASVTVRNARGPNLGLTTTSLSISATGAGGESGYGALPGLVAGAANGGRALVDVTNGDIIAGDIAITATAFGGPSKPIGAGGDARGGTAQVNLAGGIIQTTSLTVAADENLGENFNNDPTGSTFGTGTAAVDVTAGQLIVAQQLDVSASASGLFTGQSTALGTMRGGTARLTVGGTGAIVAPGAIAKITASARQADNYGAATPGLATGGTASVTANSGTLSVAGITVDARAFGAQGLLQNGLSGNATGGISRFVMNGGTVTTGPVIVAADGAGGVNSGGAGDGGIGTGGSAGIAIAGGTLITTSFAASATGQGGSGTGSLAAPSRAGGSGIGGAVTFLLSGGTATTGPLSLIASGRGGTDNFLTPSPFPRRGGVAAGGTVTATLSGGSLTTTSFAVAASGIGAVGARGTSGDGAPGGDGAGGTIGFAATGATLDLGSLALVAAGAGGRGGLGEAGYGVVSYNGGSAGDGAGGAIDVALDSGTISLLSLDINASATGGDGGAGASSPTGLDGRAGGIGGDATAGIARLRLGTPVTGLNAVAVAANATGGAGGSGETGGAGGAAIGAGASATFTTSLALLGNLQVTASATGGNAGDSSKTAGSAGGTATGGVSLITIDGPATAFALGSGTTLLVDGAAIGGNGGAAGSAVPGATGGRGGRAIGGAATVQSTGGSTDIAAASEVSFSASARGGSGGRGAGGGAGGSGADGTGGLITLSASGLTGSLTLGSGVAFDSGGNGGNGGSGGAGLTGVSQPAAANAANGTTGGVGGLGGKGGDGGTGSGGGVTLRAIDGGAFVTGAAELRVGGAGGNAGAGGDGGRGGGGGAGGAGLNGTFGQNGGGGGAGGNGGAGGGGGAAGIAAAGIAGSILVQSRGGSFTSAAATDLILNAVGTAGLAAAAGVGGSGGIGAPGGAGGAAGFPATQAGANGSNGAAGAVGTTGFSAAPNPAQGGTITVETLVGSDGTTPGRMTLGNLMATVDAITAGQSGGARYGTIVLRNSGPASAGQTMTLAGLEASAGPGSITDQSGSIDIITDNNQITITGDADLQSAGRIRVIASGSGGLTTTGALRIAAGDTLALTHTAPGGPTLAGDTIDLQARNEIVVDRGVTVRAADTLALASGDDILVRTGARLDGGLGLSLDAGGLFRPKGFGPGDIAIIRNDGVLTTTQANGRIDLRAQAIESRTMAIVSEDFTAELRNVPAPGLNSTDGGQLSADCVGGSICIGKIQSPGSVRLGPQQGIDFDLPNFIRFSGDIAATDVSIRANDSLVIGAPGAPVSLAGSQRLFVESASGDIALGGASSLTSSGGTLTVVAAGNLTGIDAILRSGGDTVIGAGALQLGTIDAGQALMGFGGFDSSPNPFLDIAGSVLVTGVVRAGGGDVDIRAGGAIDIANAGASAAGSVLLTSATSNISLTTAGLLANGTPLDIRLVANTGSIDFGDLRAGGQISLIARGDIAGGFATSDGPIRFSSNRGNITFDQLNAGSSLNLTTDGTITGGIAEAVGGDANITGFGGIDIATLSGSDLVRADSDSGIRLGTVSSALDLAIDGDGIVIDTATAGRALTVNGNGGTIEAGTLNAGVDLAVTADDAIAVETATAGTNTTLTSTAGDITGSTVQSGGNTRLTAPGGIMVRTIDSGANTDLIANAGAVTVSENLLSVEAVNATGQSIALRARGPLRTEALRATAGDITVDVDGDLTAEYTQGTGSIALTSFGGSLTVERIGTQGTQVLVPQTVSLTATGGLPINGVASSVTVGSATANDAIFISSDGVTTIEGLALAPIISIRSGDIALGAEATIGQSGTTTDVTFANTANGKTFVGGTGSTTGYALTNVELQRVFSNNISVEVASNNLGFNRFTASLRSAPIALSPTVAPDVILDNLALTGGPGGNLNGGTLRLQTPGKLRVVGTVTLEQLTASNRFEIVAGTSIEALPTGSIAMTGSGGALTGTLALNADEIVAASTPALAALAVAPDLTSASDRIGGNDAPLANDRGYFAAGGVTATVSSGIYIQNTGGSPLAGNRDFSGRRGFTVGSEGLTIVQATSKALAVVINGRQVVAATPTLPGGFVTGIDLVPNIAFVPFGANGQPGAPVRFDAATLAGSGLALAASIFDPLSTVNGCKITASRACEGGQTFSNAARDVILDAIDTGRGEPKLLAFDLVELKDFQGFIDQPLIDEPITGAANDDLWAVDDAKCDPAGGEVCK